MILYGITLIYGFLGTVSFHEIYFILHVSSFVDQSIIGVLFGFILIMSGFFFKLGLVPFHYWIADVYEGSPLVVTYFFSILPKLPILIIFIRVFSFVFNPLYSIDDFSSIYLPIVMFISCSSICVGALVLYIKQKLNVY